MSDSCNIKLAAAGRWAQLCRHPTTAHSLQSVTAVRATCDKVRVVVNHIIIRDVVIKKRGDEMIRTAAPNPRSGPEP